MAKGKVLEIPVHFGGVSIGEATARLALRISREQLSLDDADELLCGRRLTCVVTLDRKGDGSGQKTAFADANHSVDGAADVKRFGVSPEDFSTGLTFSLRDIDIRELARFSKGTGRLVISNVAAIPAESPEEQEALSE